MKRTVLIALLALSCVFHVCWAEDKTTSKFCDDPAGWDHFNTMVENNPNDVPLQILHALKIGLCVKIQNNTITETEAIDLFNDMVDTVAEQRGEEEIPEEKL